MVLAWALVFTVTLIVVNLLPATLTVLSRGSVAVCAVLVAAAAALVPRGRPAAEPPVANPHDDPRRSWVLVALASVALAAWLIVVARANATQPIGHIDALTFHLPDVARWIQQGSIWHNEQFVPLFANGNYPQSGDMLVLASILPFEQDAFARLVMYPWLLLTIVAVYALAVELGAPRPTAWLAGLAFVAIRGVIYPTVEGLPEAVLFFSFATGALFVIRYLRRREIVDLVVAGVALGLAFGTKWYGTSCVAVLLVVFVAQRLLLERRIAPALRDATIAGAVVFATGGIWMIRNVVVTPSPIFPAPLRFFGVTLFDAPLDIQTKRFGFTVSDYLGQPHIWSKYLLPGWSEAWQLTVPLALAGASVAAIVLLRRRHPVPTAQGLVVCCVGAALMLAVYTVTPNTAYGPKGAPVLVAPNARYALPGVLLALGATTWLIGRAGRRARFAGELALAAAMLYGLLNASVYISKPRWALYSVVLLALLLAAVRGRVMLVRALVAGARRPSWVVAAVLIGTIVVLAGTRGLQNRQVARRYVAPPVVAWIQAHAPSGHVIGIAGTQNSAATSPIYPAFGPRLRNEVSYVGPFREGLLRAYGRRDEFVSAIRRGGYDTLVVYRALAPHRIAPERRWAQSAGYRTVLEDAELTLMRR